MSLAEQLSRSRLRKVDKPKEPPSLLKELNAYSTVDLTKLRATSIPARRFDPSTDQWVPCDPASVSAICYSFYLIVFFFYYFLIFCKTEGRHSAAEAEGLGLQRVDPTGLP